jgi:membrane associated rhomboid family serine protease
MIPQGQPLFRLLAINLAIGASAALLMVGGLVALNPYGLRHLILTDRSPAAALTLLLFGFVITFGSAAMGGAIMTAQRHHRCGDQP